MMVPSYVKCAFVMGLALLLAGCQPHAKGSSGATGDAQAFQEIMRQGDAALALGDTAQAEVYYAQAAAQTAGGVRAHIQLATLMKARGDAAEAEAILVEAHALNPQNVEVLRELSRLYLMKGRGDMADPLIKQALNRSPDDPRLLNMRGIRLDQMGSHAEAQELYKRVIAHAYLPADKESATNNLALSYVASHKEATAIALLEAYLEKAENPAAMRQMLALAYGVAGQENNARTLLQGQFTASEIAENIRVYKLYQTGAAERSALFEASNTP